MSKSHIINLSIMNATGQSMTFNGAWFQTGGLADGNSWPETLSPGGGSFVRCCESSCSLAGCSGWVSYIYEGTPLYLSFSNPVAGLNGIDIGTDTAVWDRMTGHSLPAQREFDISGTWLRVDMIGSAGTFNNAHWHLTTPDITTVVPANQEMTNVPAAFASISTSRTRQYYQCGTAPTSIVGLLQSHFKGIGRFGDKLIFTHTNLTPVGSPNGAYLIADRIGSGNQGTVEATCDTMHPGWPHPCACQACGSFMAMGIQAAASGVGSQVSEIQILDLRLTQVNQPAKVIATIPRPNDGVNGVGMTKEPGRDGRYLVAAINGQNLTIYRSRTSSLIGGAPPEFDEVCSLATFPDSGAGVALVTQADGQIFMITLNADDSGANNTATLYFLDLQSSPPWRLKDSLAMTIPGMSDCILELENVASFLPLAGILLRTFVAPVLNSSFRWGKGVAITSPSTLELYASDRNDLSLSSIRGLNLTKDFGIVIWGSDPSDTAVAEEPLPRTNGRMRAPGRPRRRRRAR